jgi:hypothetical protein
MITQEDIQRAMAYPLASAPCTPKDIEKVLPGFSTRPDRLKLPRWTDKVYIEGWTLADNTIPYRTRVCYVWTGDDSSKQQCVFIGPEEREYFLRIDSCLGQGTILVRYRWEDGKWMSVGKLPQTDPPGPPFPDWVARGKGVVMGQISGNPHFGLDSCEILSLIAMPVVGGRGTIFWAWFLQNDVGMLFSEATYANIPERLFAIDYESFMRNAPVTEDDFSFPPATPGFKLELKVGDPGSRAELGEGAAHGQGVRFPRRPRTRE